MHDPIAVISSSRRLGTIHAYLPNPIAYFPSLKEMMGTAKMSGYSLIFIDAVVAEHTQLLCGAIVPQDKDQCWKYHAQNTNLDVAASFADRFRRSTGTTTPIIVGGAYAAAPVLEKHFLALGISYICSAPLDADQLALRILEYLPRVRAMQQQ